MNLLTILIQVRVLLNDYHIYSSEHLVGLSLEELGIRALERLPREKAIDGIHAFNELRYYPANFFNIFF